MRCLLLLTAFLICCFACTAQLLKRNDQYLLPDSIKSTGFYAEVVFHKSAGKTRNNYARLTFGNSTLFVSKHKKGSNASFNFFEKMPAPSIVSLNVRQSKKFNYDSWSFTLKEDEVYPLLILTSIDTSRKIMNYAGYIYLPTEAAWKLISVKMPSYSNAGRSPLDTNYLNWFSVNPVTHFGALSDTSKYKSYSFANRWLLRSDNSWKAIDTQTVNPPKLRPLRNIDSLERQQQEEELLRLQLPKDKIKYKEGIFYQHINEGTGTQVRLTDTVIVYYKGWLYENGFVFDQTKEKPATFSLIRLIRGWQVGLPETKVGGKIRLYIPSGSAYGIRTFSASILPNSILVFDVEVVATK